MSPDTVGTSEVEVERRDRIAGLAANQEPDGMEPFKPGSFGCHELLDRTSMLADNVEQFVLSHPSCLCDAEWYALADRAMTALRELYQKIGEAHLGNDETDGGRQTNGH